MSRNGLKGLLSVLQFLIALVILILLSAPAIKFFDNTFNAMEAIGGFNLKFSGTNYKISNFSFMNLLPYLFLAVCLIGVFIKYAFDCLDNRITRIIISVLYILAGILFLMPHVFINMASNAGGVIYDSANYGLAGASIVRAIIAFICAGLGIADAIIEPDYEYEPEPDTEMDELKNEYANLLKENKNNKE